MTAIADLISKCLEKYKILYYLIFFSVFAKKFYNKNMQNLPNYQYSASKALLKWEVVLSICRHYDVRMKHMYAINTLLLICLYLFYNCLSTLRGRCDFCKLNKGFARPDDFSTVTSADMVPRTGDLSYCYWGAVHCGGTFSPNIWNVFCFVLDKLH